MRKSEIQTLTPEALVYLFECAAFDVVKYPNRKTYNERLEKFEKEIIRRLGGDIEKLNKLR